MQTIDDLSFYFHEGFELLFLLILGKDDQIFGSKSVLTSLVHMK